MAGYTDACASEELLNRGMRNDMVKKQRGVSIIAAVFIIVILAFMGTMFVSLIGTDSLTAVNDVRSTQALFVAGGGGEFARFQFKSGTLCDALINNNIPLGQGAFSTSGQRFGPLGTTLTSAITNADSVIPVAAIAGFAPQGRIRIDDEEINYSGTSTFPGDCAPYGQPCFTRAKRGVSGTAAAAHNTIGTAVTQDQCRIQSAGSVDNAVRTEILDVPGYASASVSAFLDGPAVAVGVAETNIGSLKTVLSPGDNIIVVVVALRNTGATRDIVAGDLRLKKGAAVLASNQSVIRLGGGAVPGANVFPQETQFLLYRDVGAGPCPTYDVTARASGAGVSAEVKMVTFNNVPFSDFSDGVNVTLTNGAPGAILLTRATGLPAGENIIIAAVQLDDTANQARNVGSGDLRLRKGNDTGAVLASNQYTVNLTDRNNVNRGTGILLIARDAAGAANQTYTVTGFASANNAIVGEVKILVLNGLQAVFLDTASVGPIATTPGVTTVGSLATTFPAGDNIIIAGNQFWNTSGGSQRNIVAGDERLVYSAAIRASNQFDINLAVSNNADDFTTGLLWHHTGAPANPMYDMQASASGTSVNGETKMVAFHLNISSIPLFGWRESFP